MALWRTVKNAGAALTSQAWSSLLGLLILPIIIKGFGAEAYGLLSLSLSVVGVASICDLGIGRAVSKYVAEEGDAACPERTDRSFHTALAMALSFAVVSTAAFVLITPFLVTTVLRVQAALVAEAKLVFLFTAAAVPAILVRILLDGMLVGKQRIAVLSAVNAGANTLKIAAGLTTALCRGPVHVLVLSYCFISYLHVAALGWLCLRGRSPIATLGFAWDLELVRQLMRLGSLNTIATVMGYVFLYLDRWIIAAFLPMRALGYYAVAFDIASKQWYLAYAISQAFFPVFSQCARVSREALTSTFLHASKMNFVATTGTAVILAAFARPLLTCWISPEMGANAAVLLRMLAIGIALSCYFNVPATVLLAGSGRPEITAVQFAWAAAVHLAVSMTTVRWLGATGVALGFAAGYLAALCGSHFWLLRHALSNSALRQLWRSLLPCWAVAAAVGGPFSYAFAPLLTHTVQVIIAMAAAYAVYIALATRLSYNANERFELRQRAVSLIPLRLVSGRA